MENGWKTELEIQQGSYCLESCLASDMLKYDNICYQVMIQPHDYLNCTSLGTIPKFTVPLHKPILRITWATVQMRQVPGMVVSLRTLDNNNRVNVICKFCHFHYTQNDHSSHCRIPTLWHIPTHVVLPISSTLHYKCRCNDNVSRKLLKWGDTRPTTVY